MLDSTLIFWSSTNWSGHRRSHGWRSPRCRGRSPAGLVPQAATDGWERSASHQGSSKFYSFETKNDGEWRMAKEKDQFNCRLWVSKHFLLVDIHWEIELFTSEKKEHTVLENPTSSLRRLRDKTRQRTCTSRATSTPVPWLVGPKFRWQLVAGGYCCLGKAGKPEIREEDEQQDEFPYFKSGRLWIHNFKNLQRWFDRLKKSQDGQWIIFQIETHLPNQVRLPRFLDRSTTPHESGHKLHNIECWQFPEKSSTKIYKNLPMCSFLNVFLEAKPPNISKKTRVTEGPCQFAPMAPGLHFGLAEQLTARRDPHRLTYLHLESRVRQKLDLEIGEENGKKNTMKSIEKPFCRCCDWMWLIDIDRSFGYTTVYMFGIIREAESARFSRGTWCWNTMSLWLKNAETLPVDRCKSLGGLMFFKESSSRFRWVLISQNWANCCYFFSENTWKYQQNQNKHIFSNQNLWCNSFNFSPHFFGRVDATGLRTCRTPANGPWGDLWEPSCRRFFCPLLSPLRFGCFGCCGCPWSQMSMFFVNYNFGCYVLVEKKNEFVSLFCLKKRNLEGFLLSKQNRYGKVAGKKLKTQGFVRCLSPPILLVPRLEIWYGIWPYYGVLFRALWYCETSNLALKQRQAAKQNAKRWPIGSFVAAVLPEDDLPRFTFVFSNNHESDEVCWTGAYAYSNYTFLILSVVSGLPPCP